MDPGTAWEIGYAERRGCRYSWPEEIRLLEERTAGTGDRDADGWLIETFGLAENLMIAVNPYEVEPSIEVVLQAAAAGYGSQN